MLTYASFGTGRMVSAALEDRDGAGKPQQGRIFLQASQPVSARPLFCGAARAAGRKPNACQRTSTPAMKPIPVVTVFITSAGKIALLKRSDKVGTYRGAWAGVAGYIERLPLRQAYMELQEEAGLSQGDVELRGMGVPVIVDDPELARTWAVHPFLFEVDDPEKMTLDWEADDIRWIEPAEMADLKTVPGLDRALAAVWPPFGEKAFWDELSETALDTVRGATSLAVAALSVVECELKRNPATPVERAARALAGCRPSMAIFPHLAARLLLGESPADLSAALIAATTASAQKAAETIQGCDRILTHSYSSAVRKTLLVRRPKEVIVTESRPGCEGLLLARDLTAEGIRVIVITDAQAGLFVPEADAVLIGCDAITNDDEVANKAGTSLIALAANEAGVPVYAVAQDYKVMPPGMPYLNEEQEPDEVGQARDTRFRNVVFDLTPIQKLSAVFTENGAVTPDILSSIRAYIGAGSYSFAGCSGC